METEWIREFVTLADCCNFQQAADTLFISQSSLSRHIKGLEEELGQPLFDRTTRKVSLTRYGDLFLPYAREIVRQVYQCRTAFENEKQGIQDTLTIGSIPMMKPYGITDVMASFARQNRNIALSIIEADSIRLVQMLREGSIDIAFLREPDDSESEFNRLPFTTDTLAAFIPLDHPLGAYTNISISQLRHVPLLFIGKDAFMFNLCTSLCQQEGFTPNVVFTSRRASNIIDMVDKGMGVALLMKKPGVTIEAENVVCADITPVITTRIQVSYSKDRELSASARHFVDHLLERNPVK